MSNFGPNPGDWPVIRKDGKIVPRSYSDTQDFSEAFIGDVQQFSSRYPSLSGILAIISFPLITVVAYAHWHWGWLGSPIAGLVGAVIVYTFGVGLAFAAISFIVIFGLLELLLRSGAFG